MPVNYPDVACLEWWCGGLAEAHGQKWKRGRLGQWLSLCPSRLLGTVREGRQSCFLGWKKAVPGVHLFYMEEKKKEVN